MEFKPVTVTQLGTYLKQIFDAEELLHNISVVGEISGWTMQRGTAYFTLKDENSSMSCVCFTASDIGEFKNGDNVVIVGSPRYYVKGGKLNFNVSAIYAYGIGVLQQRFLELKAKLQALGYFDESIKKPIPSNIKRIGVVSSEEGAVIQDIINVRTRRNSKIDIVLYPVKVQGVGAEEEIAKGIEVLDGYNVDVIIVARGGGSFEDLAPFNTEIVARATYNCKKPIVSAVGHETDFTIIDFCSDLRAPTPSAAAEILCADLMAEKKYFISLENILLTKMKKFGVYKNDIMSSSAKLCGAIEYIKENNQDTINKCYGAICKFTDTYFNKIGYYLEHKTALLSKLNPENILKLGYACVKDRDNYITSVNEVVVGSKLSTKLKDGTIESFVTGVKNGI